MADPPVISVCCATCKEHIHHPATFSNHSSAQVTHTLTHKNSQLGMRDTLVRQLVLGKRQCRSMRPYQPCRNMNNSVIPQLLAVTGTQGNPTGAMGTNFSEKSCNSKASGVCQCGLITQYLYQSHSLSHANYFLPKMWQCAKWGTYLHMLPSNGAATARRQASHTRVDHCFIVSKYD